MIKHSFPLLFCFLAVSLFSQSNIQQSLSVNSTGAVPDASAQLDVSANNKGMLVPRMTSAERTAISSPATGLLVFDTNTNSFWFYNGTAWQNLSTPKTLADADDDTKIQVEESPDEDIIRFDVGGSEKMVLRKNASGNARLELPSNLYNTFVGQGAGNANTTGLGNTAVGDRAFFSNTSGSFNTASGSGALSANLSGGNNTAIGNNALTYNTEGYSNTAGGDGALFSNTTGSNNVAYGALALFTNKANSRSTAIGKSAMFYADDRTTGRETYNTAVGYEALKGSSTSANNTGRYNTAVGDQAMFSNTTGHSNTANGRDALLSNTTGNHNTAVGTSALASSTTASNNTATGYTALYANTTGNDNTANGIQALYDNTTGSRNTATGISAMSNNTTGSDNTVAGGSALYSNTTGSFNTAIGQEALSYNVANSRSTAIGRGAMVYADDRTTGRNTYNTAVGYEALRGSSTPANNTGQYNTAVGDQALFSNTTGRHNTANGALALTFNTTGLNNTAQGVEALESNTMGNENTANGVLALFSNTTGSSNTGIGYQADVLSNNLNNATAIGSNAKVGCSNCLVLGGTGADAVNVGIGKNSPVSPLDVNGATRTLGLTTTSFAAHDNGVGNRTVTMYGGNGDQWFNFRRGGAPTGHAGLIFSDHNGEHHFLYNSGDYLDFKYSTEASEDPSATHASVVTRLRIKNSDGIVGIGRTPVTNRLEVEGEASKSSAGDWLANSDACLKKNITPLNSEEMLQKLLALQGITYEWNDDKTGSSRPEGIQYGFTAQNIQTVFPSLVEEDKLGYLQTAYGTYDAMTVEAIRALHHENEALKTKVETLTSQLDKITAALQGAGIAVEK